MGPFHFVCAALTGFFAFAAIYHSILWWSSRKETLLAVFSADCLVRALFSGALASIATSVTAGDAFTASRYRLGLGMLMMVTWGWSLSLVSGVRARRFLTAVSVLFTGVCVLHLFLIPLNSAVLSVEQFVLPWGEIVSIPHTGPPGWWFAPLYAMVLSIEIFGLYCASRLRAQDRVAGTLLMAATIGIMMVHVAEIMRSLKMLSIPVVGVIPHVLWVCVIAHLIARRHRKAEQTLQDRETFLRLTQEAANVGSWEWDIATNRFKWSDELARMHGIEKSEFDGTLATILSFCHPDDAPLLQQVMSGIGSGAPTNSFECRIVRRDGTIRDLMFLGRAQLNDQGVPDKVFGIALDVTQRKRSEYEKRQLELQLTQAQKMESIGRLAGGVAHDFNNLLMVINGNCELLSTRTPPNDPAQRMLRGIHDAGERAAALTRQLLTFSRRQVVEPRILDLNTVVTETQKLLQRLIGEDIRIVVTLEPALARVKADPGQLSQVILNLSLNARDAMPTGGTLSISTANIQLNETSEETLPAAAAGSYVVLAVADTGSGIAPDVKSHIFEPFFTTKDPGKGTGLGLATVRTIAEQSGSCLSVQSEVGKGSTFKMFIPALRGATPPETSGPEVVATVQGAGTILIVEDEHAVRSLLQTFLRNCGYTILEAAGGPEAIGLVERHTGQIDLLITDVVMPEMGGRKLAEHLTQLRPGLKVLYLSGYTDDAVLHHGISHAEVAFLQKPFDMSTLATKVRQMLSA